MATKKPLPRLNAEWHRAHRMPKNPTPAQRLAWHLAHVEHCGCRPMPATLKRELTGAAQRTRATAPVRRRTTRART